MIYLGILIGFILGLPIGFIKWKKKVVVEKYSRRGILEKECSQILKDFFLSKRKKP